MIPFIDLRTQYERIRSEINDALQSVLDGGQYIMGPAVKGFEQEMQDYLGCKHAISVSSGTDALFIPLLALELNPHDAVFVPSFTYTATAEAILLAHATPVFVDVDAGSFNIDIDSLREQIHKVKREGKLTPRAILAVDLYGQPADYESINAIADEEGMYVIADAAQAFGAMKNNRKVGTLTHCSATSFYPSKPLGCYGDGGAIFVDDDKMAALLRSVRVHGTGDHKYDVVRIGMNGRLDSIQAAILSAKLKIFDDELESRERVASIYDERLKDTVSIPARVPDSRSAWAQYTIRTDDRSGLIRTCGENDVPTMVFYPKPMHLQSAYEAYGEGGGSVPVSETICEQVLSLPMNPYLADATVHQICDVIEGHFRA